MVEIKNLFASFFSYTFFTFLSRFTGFIRDVLMARYIGVSYVSDAFFAAWRIPNSLRRLTSDGIVSSVFVPVFVSLPPDKKTLRAYLGGNIMVIMTIISTIICISIGFFPYKIIKIIMPGFKNNQEQLTLAGNLLFILNPYLIATAVVAVFGGMLNSIGRFSYFAGVQVILNIAVGLFLIIFQRSSFIVYYMSIGIIVGGLCQIAVMFIGVLRCKISPKLGHIQELKVPIKNFLRNLVPVFLGQGVSQVNLIVGSIFASQTNLMISYLYYVDRVGQFTISMIGHAFGTISLPLMAKYIARGQKYKSIYYQQESLKWTAIFSMPAAAGIFSLALPIMTFIYGGGKLSDKNLITMSIVLQIYAISIFISSWNRVLTSSFYAYSDTKTPMYISFNSLLCNILFNLYFFNKHNYYGIVISLSIVNCIDCILLLILLKLKHHFIYISQRLTKTIIISLTGCIFIIIYGDKLYNFLYSTFHFSVIILLPVAIVSISSLYLLVLVFTKVINLKYFKTSKP